MPHRMQPSRFSYMTALAASLAGGLLGGPLSGTALAQGLSESTSIHGTAAGLGSGIGAGAFKLFNSLGAPPGGQGSSYSSTGSSQGGSSSPSSKLGKSQTLKPVPRETTTEIESKSRALMQRAQEARASGDIKACARTTEELARFRSKHFGNTDSGAAEAYLKAGELYESSKEYAQAEDAFKSALGFTKRISGESSPRTAPILLKLADALAAQERNSEAAPYYKQLLILQNSLPARDTKTVQAARLKLGEAYYKSANYKEAESTLKQIIDENAKSEFLNQEELAKVDEMHALSVKHNTSAIEPAK